jgi:hypothetical protein
MLQAPAIFSAPGFKAELHVGYDFMHTIGGVVQDTFLQCLMGKRFSDNAAAQLYEETFNGDRLQGMPQMASSEDKDRAVLALQGLVEAVDSRACGSRLLRLFDGNKKNKMHSMYFLAGPYGGWMPALFQWSAIGFLVYSLQFASLLQQQRR